MTFARRRCHRNPRGASPTHRMETDDRAICGANLMRPTEYWEEMEEPEYGWLPGEYCHNCWQIEEARRHA